MFLTSNELGLEDFLKAISFIPPKGTTVEYFISPKEINGTTVYEIKGDNNNRSDPYYVTADQIQARVLKWGDNPVVIPKVGYLSLWLRGL